MSHLELCYEYVINSYSENVLMTCCRFNTVKDIKIYQNYINLQFVGIEDPCIHYGPIFLPRLFEQVENETLLLVTVHSLQNTVP